MNKTLAVLTLSVFLSACGGEIEPGRTAAAGPVVTGLELATVSPGLLPEAEAFVGTVESPDRGVLSARVDGRVTRILVREGDRVKAGTLLLTIQDNTAGDRLAEAEGARKSTAARVELAEKTFARYRRLFAEEAVTPQEMDRVSAELEMARQGLASATAAVDAARTALSYTRVSAPYEARVVQQAIEEGSTVMPGTPLLILDRQGVWRVRARLPESHFDRTTVGENFNVEIPALGRTFPGKVAAILPAADPQSRSFEVKIALEEAEGLSSGMFARVATAGAGRSAILAPASALVQRGQLTGVYVVENGILRYRLVRTGRKVGDQVEILSGLSSGETIVAAGTERARNGARVEG